MRTKRIHGAFLTLAFLACAVFFNGFSLEVRAVSYISSEADLRNINNNPGESYQLLNDITVSGWTSLGEFTGTLDGQGHVIKGLTASLFTSLGSGAVVENLGFANANIQVGGIISGLTDTNAKATYCYAFKSNVLNGTQGNELLGSQPHGADCYYGPADFVQLVGTPGSYELRKYIFPIASGSGYSISSAQELSNLSQVINDGIMKDATDFATQTYTVLNDISGISMPAIGTNDKPFKGKFDANGKVLDGLTTGNKDGDTGFFGTVDSAQISNLGWNGTVVSRVNNTTGQTTRISKSYSTGNALVGQMTGDLVIENSYSTADSINFGIVGIQKSGTLTLKNSYTTAPQAVSTVQGSVSATNSYATGSSASGITQRTLEDMKKSDFAIALNKGSGSPVYGFVGSGNTPFLIGVGQGKDALPPEAAQIKIKIKQPTNGTLKVYNASNQEIISEGLVASGSRVRLVATPNTGFELDSIQTVTGQTTTPFTTSTDVYTSFSTDVELTAAFKSYQAYDVKIVKNAGGKISPDIDTVKVRVGTKQSFTITPDVDCRIQSVNYSGNGMTVDGSTYTIGPVTRNETLTVKFVSKAEGVKDVTVTAGGGVVVTVKALENVAEQISSNIGNTIRVTMDKSTVLDKNTLQAMAGNDVNVLLDMKEYSWRINGRSVSYWSNSSINLGVTTNASTIDAESMKKFSGFEDKTQLDLSYSGAFPFVGYLTVKAPGKDTIGKFGTLFYFNETTKAFESVGYQRVADDGTLTFGFNHASKYVLVVANRALSVQDLGVGAPAVDVVKPLEMKTSDLLFASILFVVVAGGGVLLAFVLRKTR